MKNPYECTGKDAFDSIGMAEKVRRRMAGRKRRQQQGRQVRVYKCHHCKKWHIGSSFG